MLLAGETRKGMASHLGVSVRTVDFHLGALKGKLCARCLVTLALKIGGLAEPPGRPRRRDCAKTD